MSDVNVIGSVQRSDRGVQIFGVYVSAEASGVLVQDDGRININGEYSVLVAHPIGIDRDGEKVFFILCLLEGISNPFRCVFGRILIRGVVHISFGNCEYNGSVGFCKNNVSAFVD